eukprot:831789_1
MCRPGPTRPTSVHLKPAGRRRSSAKKPLCAKRRMGSVNSTRPRKKHKATKKSNKHFAYTKFALTDIAKSIINNGNKAKSSRKGAKKRRSALKVLVVRTAKLSKTMPGSKSLRSASSSRRGSKSRSAHKSVLAKRNLIKKLHAKSSAKSAKTTKRHQRKSTSLPMHRHSSSGKFTKKSRSSYKTESKKSKRFRSHSKSKSPARAHQQSKSTERVFASVKRRKRIEMLSAALPSEHEFSCLSDSDDEDPTPLSASERWYLFLRNGGGFETRLSARVTDETAAMTKAIAQEKTKTLKRVSDKKAAARERRELKLKSKKKQRKATKKKKKKKSGKKSNKSKRKTKTKASKKKSSKRNSPAKKAKGKKRGPYKKHITSVSLIKMAKYLISQCALVVLALSSVALSNPEDPAKSFCAGLSGDCPVFLGASEGESLHLKLSTSAIKVPPLTQVGAQEMISYFEILAESASGKCAAFQNIGLVLVGETDSVKIHDNV